ncbi:MAG: hypothetical protein M1827_005639 [Pycnora praestabilis]|nr:MAG: hypothetical protein M1827_005639 [Pycnora praestabilis]
MSNFFQKNRIMVSALATSILVALFYLITSTKDKVGFSPFAKTAKAGIKISSGMRKRRGMGTLYPSERWYGGRVGEPVCSEQLGAPGPWNCGVAISAMPAYMWNKLADDTPPTMYLSPFDLVARGALTYAAAMAGLHDPIEQPPGGYVQVPMVYSFRDCGIIVKTKFRGDDERDMAITNAVKQTALSIKNSCLTNGPRIKGSIGKGGWQIAGANQNLNITIFKVYDPDYHKAGQRRDLKTDVNRPATLADLNYQRISAEQAIRFSSSTEGGEGSAGLETASIIGDGGKETRSSCSMGYSFALVGECCPGFKYVEEPVTEANVETFSTILGMTYQSLLNLGLIGWCGAPGLTTTVGSYIEL